MAFADEFSEGGINEGFERSIDPPVLVDCQVRYSIWEDGQVAECEPSTGDSQITLWCEGSDDTGINAHHEAAWRHFEAHAGDYERALRDALWKIALGNYDQAAGAAKEDDNDEFAAFAAKADFTSPQSLDLQVALAEIFLYGAGPNDRGYISFELSSGWDDEHGVSVIMHGAEVKGVSGRSEFTCRGDPTGHIAYCAPP